MIMMIFGGILVGLGILSQVFIGFLKLATSQQVMTWQEKQEAREFFKMASMIPSLFFMAGILLMGLSVGQSVMNQFASISMPFGQ